MWQLVCTPLWTLNCSKKNRSGYGLNKALWNYIWKDIIYWNLIFYKFSIYVNIQNFLLTFLIHWYYSKINQNLNDFGLKIQVLFRSILFLYCCWEIADKSKRFFSFCLLVFRCKKFQIINWEHEDLCSIYLPPFEVVYSYVE